MLLFDSINCGDCGLLLSEIPDDLIDLTVTSPPYDALRTYNGYSFDFETIANELYRITTDGGIVAWIVNDGVSNGSESLTSCKQKIYFAEQCGFRIHDTMFYIKRNFSHPEKVRYHQVVEYVFILSKGTPRTFNPIKDKKNATAGCVGNLGVNTFTERDGSKSVRPKKVTGEYGMRTNAWEGLTRGQEEMCIPLQHPAMMPKWLARDLISSWSNPGDLVLDPFCGSGTSCIEAKKLQRRYIGIDISDEYCSMARNGLLKI
jgi:site-specific DNA-methyltransferase (adenine-specific)